ncbi:MAG: diphthine synthase [Nitrososphaerota archaeon]
MGLMRTSCSGLMALYLVGLGLGSRGYLTRKAIEAIEGSSKAYLDVYTSIIEPELIEELRRILGTRLIEADRKLLEEGASRIIEEAEGSDVAILVPGDPLIATTHIAIMIEAARRGIKCRVIHGVSAHSALISASCLQAYKFGKTVTMPRSGVGAETCYRTILENMERGLHTLVLLDTADGGLDIPLAIRMLMQVEDEAGMGLITPSRLIICLARIGFEDEVKWAGSLAEALERSYPPPPHSMIFPGILHFSEAEALEIVLGARPEVVESHKLPWSIWQRLQRYIASVESALRSFEMLEESREVKEIRDLAERYLDDSRRFLSGGRGLDSLAAISYAEGLLDCLRMLGKARFSWSSGQG